MILSTLGAGQNHIVVTHEDALSFLGWKQVAIHAANAGDHAVGGRIAHQVVDLTAAPLGCDGQCPIFNKGIRVIEIFEVLANRAMACAMAFSNRFRSGAIQA